VISLSKGLIHKFRSNYMYWDRS